MTQTEALRLALEALESNRRTHHYCEDTWYSCPKHEDGCANDSEGDECNCGADEANAGIDQAITAIKAALEAKDEPVGEVLNERGEVDYISYVPPVGTALYTTPPKQEAKDEPVPVAIVEVFGKDWRLDYMALPVGKHKLYAQQYTYTTPPQQEAKDEPVAWVYPEFWQHLENLNCGTAYRLSGIGRQPLYSAPQKQPPVIDKSVARRIATQLGWEPPRTWVGLTDEEVTTCHSLAVLSKKHDGTDPSFTTLLHRQIEAKLKEKNT